MEAYLDKLKTTNVRLVAANNFDPLNQNLADVKASNVISTAVIEEKADVRVLIDDVAKT